MKNIKFGTIVRSVVLFFVLLNQLLVLMGYSPLPFKDEEIENFSTGVLTVAASVWAWWKNNSITREARRKEALIEREERFK